MAINMHSALLENSEDIWPRKFWKINGLRLNVRRFQSQNILSNYSWGIIVAYQQATLQSGISYVRLVMLILLVSTQIPIPLNACISPSLVKIMKVVPNKNVHVCTQNCVATLTATVSNKKNEIGITKVHTNNV